MASQLEVSAYQGQRECPINLNPQDLAELLAYNMCSGRKKDFVILNEEQLSKTARFSKLNLF